jgi:glycine cleavage system H protein
MFPADLKYTKEHEWAKVEGDRARIGITDFAQDQLGDVVFVELPKVGTKVTRHVDLRGGGVGEGGVGSSSLRSPASGGGQYRACPRSRRR